jgi:hypothetical protein
MEYEYIVQKLDKEYPFRNAGWQYQRSFPDASHAKAYVKGAKNLFGEIWEFRVVRFPIV